MIKHTTMIVNNLLLVAIIAPCGKTQELPNPNPLHPVYDLPHYRRDTLNFFHAKLEKVVEESVDSIIRKCSTPENLHWIIRFYHKKWNTVYYRVSIVPIGNIFISLDEQNLPYKCAIIDNKKVFIIDEYDQVSVDLAKPFIKVWNPKIHKGFSYTEHSTWYFEKKGDKVCTDRRMR